MFDYLLKTKFSENALFATLFFATGFVLGYYIREDEINEQENNN